MQIDDPPNLGLQTDHAAANETSLTMALRPELVNIGNLPKNKSEKPLGVWGKDPRRYANSDDGRKIIDLQVGKILPILKKKLEYIL